MNCCGRRVPKRFVGITHCPSCHRILWVQLKKR